MIPVGTASVWGWVAASTSPHRQPPPTRTVALLGSTVTEFIGERSMTTPSSALARPPQLWPPAAHREWESLLAREADHRGDVVGRLASGDQRRPLVDHRVEEGPGLVVALSSGPISRSPNEPSSLRAASVGREWSCSCAFLRLAGVVNERRAAPVRLS